MRTASRPKTPAFHSLHHIAESATLPWRGLDGLARGPIESRSPPVPGSKSRMAFALSREVAAYLQAAFPQSGPLALDGKTRKNSASAKEPQRHLLTVIRHELMTMVTQADVGEKENEIPVVRRVLKTLPLKGVVVTADALHTQADTGRQIVDQGGDYVLTVKANQPSLHQALEALDWRFSPLGHDA